MISPIAIPLPAAPRLTVAEIRDMLGDEAVGLTDEQVLMIDAQCRSVACVVCDLAIAQVAVDAGRYGEIS